MKTESHIQLLIFQKELNPLSIRVLFCFQMYCFLSLPDFQYRGIISNRKNEKTFPKNNK